MALDKITHDIFNIFVFLRGTFPMYADIKRG